MKLYQLTDFLYSLSPMIYNLQLNFFNGNHFEILKKKLRNIPKKSILEIGCGNAPILAVLKPKRYVGIDIDQRFINVAKKKYSLKNYSFISGDATNFTIDEEFDLVILSHTTHHFTDEQMKLFLYHIKRVRFKHLVIYDGKPVGIFAPLLTKLDLGATFRELEEFYSFFNKDFIILHSETFRSNRPFYKYPLLIISKKIYGRHL